MTPRCIFSRISDDRVRCRACGRELVTRDDPERVIAECKGGSRPLGLGDRVERGLSRIGITKERVAKVFGSCGGCEKRQEFLNRLGRYIGIGGSPNSSVEQRSGSILPAGAAHICSRVQFMVKSFRRFGCLLRCIRSIKRHYPDANILIADDSFEEVPEVLPAEVNEIRSMDGVEWIQMPFDSGLSAGRNEMVRRATAEFLVNCDDDFVFTRETRIENLLAILMADESIDIAAGIVRQKNGVAENWCGHFSFSGERPKRSLTVNPLWSEWSHVGDVWYRQTDLVLNFFAARRKSLLRFPWDDRFKITGEHLDHFLSICSGGGKVVYTPSVIVGHLQDSPADYGRFRKRYDYATSVHQKWGLAGHPHHRASPEPCIPVRDLRAMLAVEEAGRPNVILFGVGHSGTSIATRMLHELGWGRGDADDEFAESVSIRAINTAAIGGDFDFKAAKDALSRLPQPWAIKDPRFVHTIGLWLDLLARYEPTLVWIARDLEDVRRSYERRGENTMRFGMELEELYDLAAATFHAWPWGKVRVEYEALADAVAMWARPNPCPA